MVAAELLFAGYYRGPETFLGSYTWLKLFAGERYVFAESNDPAYDFSGRLRALGLCGGWDGAGGGPDGSAMLLWGRYRRGADVPALNWGGQEVGRLADAIESLEWFGKPGQQYPFQAEVVGPGQLHPTTHNVVLSYVAAPDAELGAAADGGAR